MSLPALSSDGPRAAAMILLGSTVHVKGSDC
jgi:hypothetical protein